MFLINPFFCHIAKVCPVSPEASLQKRDMYRRVMAGVSNSCLVTVCAEDSDVFVWTLL